MALDGIEDMDMDSRWTKRSKMARKTNVRQLDGRTET